jgi:predicted esterase
VAADVVINIVILSCAADYHLCLLQSGQPQVFVSHGVKDDVLAIDKASRRIMPRLKSLLPEKGQLQYIEFQGKHEVPPAVVSKALKWFFQ